MEKAEIEALIDERVKAAVKKALKAARGRFSFGSRTGRKVRVGDPAQARAAREAAAG